MLDEEFLQLLGLAKYRLAKDIGVPTLRSGDIVPGKRVITQTPNCGSAGTSGSPMDGGLGPGPLVHCVAQAMVAAVQRRIGFVARAARAARHRPSRHMAAFQAASGGRGQG